MSDDLERACVAASRVDGQTDSVRAALLSFLDMDEAGVERLARAVCVAGGGEPDRLMTGYIVTRGVRQADERHFDHGKGKWVENHAFWRSFQTEARAVLSELRKMAGEKE